MPKFLEDKLKTEYGANSAVPYKVMNAIGAARGNKETAKGRAMEAKHMKKISKSAAARIRSQAAKMALLLMLCVIPAWAAPSTFQVTIGATATQISTTHLYCSAWIIQNNAAHAIRFGDSGVTSSKGVALASGSPGGSYTTTASMNGSQPNPDDLSQWYIAGTQNDVIDVTCKVVNF